MPAPAGGVHVLWLSRLIESGEENLKFVRVRRLDASFGAGLVELLQPSVLERLDRVTSVMRHGTRIKVLISFWVLRPVKPDPVRDQAARSDFRRAANSRSSRLC